MSENTKVSGADIDKALEAIQLHKSVEDTVVLEKAMPTVPKRTMGGEVAPQNDEQGVDVGRNQKNVKDVELGRLPQSKGSGNFATSYKEGNGLSDAERENAKNPQPNRGITKAVDESSKSSDKEVEKAFPDNFKKDEDKKDEKVEKAFPDNFKKEDKKSDESSDSSVEKAVTPEKEDKGMCKALDLMASAQKHLTKAFEDGSDADLDKTGENLVEAKNVILKSIESGEKISEEVITRLDKSARYFSKALETYEKEDADGHVRAVEKTQKHLGKAIAAYQSFQKSLDAAPVKSEGLKFAHRDGKVVLEMTEDEAKLVRKSLQKDNLYKSLETEIPEEAKKVLDATPLLKSLFSNMTTAYDRLQDTVADKSEKDRDFRKSVSSAVETLGKSVKQVLEDVESLKGTPNLRKSIVSVVESPKAEATVNETMDRAHIEATLEKGLKAQLIEMPLFLAWDIDKVMDVIPEKYVEACKYIDARTK
jgi:hypothetical protein